MQKLDPIVQQMGQLIDARIKTLEVNLKAEIKESEGRVTRNLRGEIKESEERLTRKLQVFEDKLDGKVGALEVRVEVLEDQVGVASTP